MFDNPDDFRVDRASEGDLIESDTFFSPCLSQFDIFSIGFANLEIFLIIFNKGVYDGLSARVSIKSALKTIFLKKGLLV
jgi:hypothetical protein